MGNGKQVSGQGIFNLNMDVITFQSSNICQYGHVKAQVSWCKNIELSFICKVKPIEKNRRFVFTV